MAFVDSAKFACLVQISFLIAASNPAFCANLPAPEEHDKDPGAASGNVPALHHVEKRHSLDIVKYFEPAAPPSPTVSSTPAPGAMATVLDDTGKILRLATWLPAKTLKLVRTVGVGILNTSIGIPETILERASEMSLADVHLAQDPSATTTPPPVAVMVETPVEVPTAEAFHGPPAWLDTLVALKLQKKMLLKKIELLKLQMHGKVVIQKKTGPLKKEVVIISPKSVDPVPLPPVTPTPSPLPDVDAPEVIVVTDAPETTEPATTPAEEPTTTPAEEPTTTPAEEPTVGPDSGAAGANEPTDFPDDEDPVTKESLINKIKDKLSEGFH